MGYGDWIFLGILLICCGLGALLGFGKVLCWFVLNKVVRIIIAIFICYTFGGMILGIPFINQMLKDLAANWEHIGFLKAIHLEYIIYYIVLGGITVFAVWITARILRSISESQSKPIKVFNRIAGALLLSAFALALMLLIFQIIYGVGVSTHDSFGELLSQNAPAILKPLYEKNPMSVIFK